MTDTTRPNLHSAIVGDMQALTAESDQLGRVFGSKHHLGHNDFRALLQIMVADVAGTPVSPTELGHRLGLTSAAMTYLTERLITSGHIHRESDPKDRRRVILRYADHGMEVAREFFGPLGEHTRSALADLSDSDLEAAHRVLTALTGAMKTYQDELGSR